MMDGKYVCYLLGVFWFILGGTLLLAMVTWLLEIWRNRLYRGPKYRQEHRPMKTCPGCRCALAEDFFGACPACGTKIEQP